MRALMLAAALWCGAAAADEATLRVTGTGTASGVPDMATISVGVETQEADAAAALDANARAAAAVIAALKEAGVADRDLRTGTLSVFPVYDNRSYDSGGRGGLQGYRVVNRLDARIRDLDGLGAVLDTVVDVGANRIDGVRLGLSEPKPVLDRARVAAVADAKDRARLYAEAAGVELGPILSITEGGGAGPSPMRAVMEAASMDVPIERGEASLSASVTIVWEIGEPD